MKLIWAADAWKDYLWWQEHDRSVLTRINELIKECLRTPFSGKGKPEPLRHTLKGLWSRRVTGEHRLVYKVTDEALLIIACRYHY
ncbi:Txe/YoeB family addiction module toxin [Scandinavium sp. NPDC088450]|uniref:Txe/YoeB family addiction module toxin n=1 Tax=Scandinavium sp. NPDC088450 TaxID=3364514 RepID=UPI00385137A9